MQTTLLAILSLAGCGFAWSADAEPWLPVAAQPGPATREEALRAAREQKVAGLRPEQPEPVERLFDRFTNGGIFNRVFASDGLRLKVGGLYTGSGFAFGPEYYRPDLANGNVTFRATALASLNRYYLAEVALGMPRLAGGRMAVELLGRRLDAPRMAYYGPGRESRKEGRSNFRKEETSFDVTAAWRPAWRHLRAGVSGGYLAVNVGPGRDPRFASALSQFSGSGVAGLNEQSGFLRGGPFVELDRRDSATDPHSGGRYRAAYTFYNDRQLGGYGFRRLEAEATQYVSFFNKKRVVAVRTRTELSYRNQNQQVPFYLQPTLGGSDDLRGYRQFRFYDNNLMVANAEYRWEAFPALDMAVFADNGKVFHRLREFDLRHLQTSAGIGFRFKSRDQVAFRVDTAFSREGLQVWFKFNDIF